MNEGNKHFMKLTKFWKVVKLNRSRVVFLGGKVTGRRVTGQAEVRAAWLKERGA
jgi:hypothetical protein